MKKFKTIHIISKSLLSLMMLFSSGMYIFNHEAIVASFLNLGFPTYVIYPLAAAKILGLLAIWFGNSNALKEWAYAGFFFNFLLAFAAHVAINDGEHFGAVLALIFLFGTYFSWKKLGTES